MGINKDQVKGRAEAVTSKEKEVAGNKDLEMQGDIRKSVGVVQATVGDAKEDIAKAIRP